MFKITIICLGKFKEAAYRDLEKEYLKRLNPYAVIKVIELSEEPYTTQAGVEAAKEKEAKKVQKQIPKDSIVILLEEKGIERNSKDFAVFLDRVGNLGQQLVFVIGSGVGLDSSLKAVSNYQISLSQLTFPHNLARILLTEQLYRSVTILNGHKYHKE